VNRRIPLTLALAGLLLGACSGSCGADRDLQGCKQACEKLGVVPGGRVCETMCTKDCDELANTYGISKTVCRRMQAGEL